MRSMVLLVGLCSFALSPLLSAKASVKTPGALEKKPAVQKKTDAVDVGAKPLSKADRNLYEKGNRLILQGMPKQAIKTFQELAQKNPKFPEAQRGLGIAYARLAQPEQSVAAYEAYLKLAPNAPDAKRVQKILDSYYKEREAEKNEKEKKIKNFKPVKKSKK